MLAYKITCLVVGWLTIVVGAVLLVILPKGKPTSVTFSGTKWLSLKMTQAAPGTVLALYGAVVMWSSIHKGWNVERTVETISGPVNQASSTLPSQASAPADAGAPSASPSPKNGPIKVTERTVETAVDEDALQQWNATHPHS